MVDRQRRVVNRLYAFQMDGGMAEHLCEYEPAGNSDCGKRNRDCSQNVVVVGVAALVKEGQCLHLREGTLAQEDAQPVDIAVNGVKHPAGMLHVEQG